MTTEATTAAGLSADLSGDYVVDTTHSRFGFNARHAMVTKVRGSFTEFAGTGRLDAQNPAASSVALTIQAASIDTRNADRDAHLRSNDFFDMEQYPTIEFRSTEITQTGATTFDVTGELTIKGTTKTVTIPVEFTGAAVDPFGNQRIGFEGSTVINRKDWGVNWNAALEAGGVLVSEKVTLELDISAIKQA